MQPNAITEYNEQFIRWLIEKIMLVYTPSTERSICGCMEDVLDLYQQPFNKDYPVVCMDEKPSQLLDEARHPIPMKPGKPERRDSEHVRHGTCSIFIFTEPLAGWRHISVRERRTRIDWAQEIKELLDVHYPDAVKVLLVLDNLNTHTIASLYEAFDPVTARRLAKRLELHYTPKHGSLADLDRQRGITA